jgi:hypothetical protein
VNVVVFPQEVAGFVIDVEDGAVDAADFNPLAEGVVSLSGSLSACLPIARSQSLKLFSHE